MKKILKRASAAVIALAVAATAVVFDVPEKLVAAAVGSRSRYDYQVDVRAGILTINSDTGMADWKENGFMDADDVQTVEMDSSVTSIPEGAFGFCQNLTSVEIGSGVQTIDADAFYNCSSLTEITVAGGNSTYSSADGVLFNTDKTQLICYPEGKQGSSYEIPNTVTSIEQSAFENCRQLTSVTAATGSRLTTIKDYAFRYCLTLASITIPEGVTSLGINAFNSCDFQNITIPASLTSMSIDESNGNPFINCDNLTAINVAADNTEYSSANGILFDKNKTKLICCPGGTQGSYEIPNTVTSVETWAFYSCKKLTSVTIPNTVTSIGAKAFSFCNIALTSVTIPSSVTSIGNSAFQQCSKLATVTFEKVTPPTIGTTIFDGCSQLAKIMVPARSVDTYKAVSNLQTYQEKIVEGEADNPCGDNAAWEYDETTKTLTISGTGAMTDWTSSRDVPWNDKAADIKNVVIDSGVTSVGKYAFKGCSSLTSVTIPNGVDSIGSWAFDGCTSLTSITIPNSVTSIKTYAFQNSGLSSITIAEGSQLKDIGTRAFYNCSYLTAIDIPGSVTSINQEAFSGCTSLSSIAIPNGVTSISANTFNGCSSLSSITIPNSVTYIGANAFYNCSSLTAITIPNDVTIIDDRAFSGCSSLSSITIPGKVATIGQSAFSNCTGLSSITIPNSVNIIYATAFSGCTNLKTVTFENATPPATIGTTLFDNCTNLEKIFVPADSVDTYKAVERLDPYKDKITAAPADNKCGDNATWAYDDTTKTLTISGTGAMNDWIMTNSTPWADKMNDIKNIVINSGITSIGEMAFGGCSNLTSVTIPNTVTSISANTFNGCSSLTSITIPNSVTSIGKSAFQFCAGLESIKIPGSVTSIEDYAFSRCTNLETVTFDGTTPPTMGSNVFYDCNALDKIAVPEGKADAYKSAVGSGLSDKVTDSTTDNKCGDNATWALDETTKTLTISGTGDMTDWTLLGSDVPWADKAADIEKVVINSGITSVGDLAFRGCTGLTSVTIPDGVTSIGTNAFEGCSGLTSVNIPNTVTSIGDGAFSGSGLTSVTIPDGVTSIGDAAFSDSGLTSVTIPDSVTSIGNSAFQNCTSLTSITIPKNVNSIGGEAFDGCTNLETVTFKGATPPATMGNEVFKDCAALDKIVVPEGKADAYKTAIADLSEKITADTGDIPGGDDDSGDSSDSSSDSSNSDSSSDSSDNSSDSGDSDNSGSDDDNNHEPDNSGSDDDNNSGNSSSNENTSKDVQLGENVPKTEFATPTEELISAVLTPEELAQLKDTDKVSVVLEIVENVPAEDKQSVGGYLESGSHVLAQYMDVALYKIINDSKTRITSTNKPIRITFEVPEGLRAADRTFAVLRVHNGETVLLPDLDNDENTVTIETDRFSTYALVYRDNASVAGDDNPPTGVAFSLIPFTAALAVVVIATKRKK